MADYENKGKENENCVDSVSDYALGLDTVSRERYDRKLELFDGRFKVPDPYVLKDNEWSLDMTKWPPIEYADLFNYFINTPGIYTKEALKAYKSLDGYDYFISGHVHEVFHSDVSPDSPVCLLKARVLPSQRLNDEPHDPWICVDRLAGYIIAAHCTCKAGLGEACSHIAGVLFKVEAGIKLGYTKLSKTSAACVWNRFYKKNIDSQPLSEINFSRSVRGRGTKRPFGQTEEVNIDPVDEEMALHQLKQIFPSAGILTKDDSDTDTASDDDELPSLLTRFHEVEYSTLRPEDLQEKCATFLSDFKPSETQLTNLEKITRSQSQSVLWQRHREGRITATIGHDIKTMKTAAVDGILKRVMKYEEKDLSKVEAVSFGIYNERKAKELYCSAMKTEHADFHMRDSGLVIDATCPIFAASPDGVRNCKCHGKGLLEVKCSFKHKDLDVCEIVLIDPSFYLDKDLKLKESHRYYTQIQFQMYVCQVTFCDFVVFTLKGISTHTVEYNPNFVSNLVQKCSEFAFNHVVLEILCHKLFNKDAETNICLCKRPSFGKTVICSKPDCEIKKYHLPCVNLQRKPRGSWTCISCM